MAESVFEVILKHFGVLALLVPIIVQGGTTKKDLTTTALDKVYADCIPETSAPGNICFGLPDSQCWTKNTCSLAVMLSDNDTEVIIRTGFDLSSTSAEPYNYIIGISVDPFINNGMGTPKPICKEKVTAQDFIVRIFRFKNSNESQSVFSDYPGESVSREGGYVSIPKSHWTQLCQEVIVKEYNSKINTLDARYIVFQNKFYFDLLAQHLQTTYDPIRISVATLEDFKDPALYSTKDARLYINFNLASTTTPSTSESETSHPVISGATKLRIGGIVTLLLIWLSKFL